MSISRASGCAGLCKTSGDQSVVLQNQTVNEERFAPDKSYQSSHRDEEVRKKEGE